MSSTRSAPIVRLAHVVGDFGNPFYAEERQRDVWNEASAFGFQLVLWCALTVGTVTVWVVGAPAVPYVAGAMLLVGAVSGLTVAYAQHLGVELTGRDRMLRWRLLPYALLVVALLVGLLRARQEPLDASTVAGMVTGAGTVALVAAVSMRRRSREP
jgi:hypothetical protein